LPPSGAAALCRCSRTSGAAAPTSYGPPLARPIHARALDRSSCATSGREFAVYQLVQERPGHVRIVPFTAPGRIRNRSAHASSPRPGCSRTRSTPRSSSTRPCRGRGRQGPHFPPPRGGSRVSEPSALSGGHARPAAVTGRPRRRSRFDPHPLRPTPLEIASGRCTANTTSRGARAHWRSGIDAARRARGAILPALRRTPCLVSFSGGRDSSSVLGAATRAGRRQGLSLPVPIAQALRNLEVVVPSRFARPAQAPDASRRPQARLRGVTGGGAVTARGSAQPIPRPSVAAPRASASIRGVGRRRTREQLRDPGGDGSTGSCVDARCARRG
jgi:hypothetical protein